MLRLTGDELQAILKQLDQAMYNHMLWYEALVRTLVCRLPFDKRDVSRNAHRECLFGQWYYSPATERLRAHPGFVALEAEHESIHRIAAELLEAGASGAAVPLLDYERFSNALNAMRLQLGTLKRELEDLLYNRDPLTRTYSRIGMLTKLRELQELARRGMPSCCIMMDLDRFKEINDRLGHQAGDRLLAEAAAFVIEHLRPFDKVYRYGGDEFLIVLQHAEAKQGFEAVERIREGLAAHPIMFDGNKMCITASFGLAMLHPDEPVERTLEMADKALYAAKNAGHNCTRMWQEGM